MSDFKQTTLRGIFWSVNRQFASQLIMLVETSVLARLLLPSEFGLVGMITITTGFLQVLKDFGFGAALVQKKDVTSADYNLVFWSNIVIGFICTGIVFFSAPYIAEFYHDPEITAVARVLSFSFLVNAFGMVSSNMLLRDVDFKKIFITNSVSNGVAVLVAIVCAYYGLSYWSLVIQRYTAALVFNIICVYYTRWRPSLTFQFSGLKRFLSFGGPLLLDQSINYWMRNVDNVLIGRFLGKESLGYYTKAYALMLLPVRQLSGTLTKVLFPSYSRIQDDVGKIRSTYLKISRGIALLAFPLMMILGMLAEPVIMILMGKNWAPVVPLFRVLCWLGMFQAIGTLSGNIYLSLGKTSLMLKVGLFSRAIMIGGIVVGFYAGGLMGVAYGYLISSLLAFMPELYFVGRLIGLTLLDIILNFVPYLLVSCVSGLAIYLIDPYFAHLPDLVRLAIGGAAGGGVFLVLAYVIRAKALFEMLSLIKETRLKQLL